MLKGGYDVQHIRGDRCRTSYHNQSDGYLLLVLHRMRSRERGEGPSLLSPPTTCVLTYR